MDFDFSVTLPRQKVCLGNSIIVRQSVINWLRTEIGEEKSLLSGKVCNPKRVKWDFSVSPIDEIIFWFINEQDAIKFKLRWG